MHQDDDKPADDIPGETSAAAPDAKPKKPRKPRAKKEPTGPAPEVGSPDVELLALDGGYDVVVMDRRELEDWPFNPRHMRPEAAKALKEGLEAVKLLRPCVTWNKRNSQIVAGHKKLEQIDKIMGTDAYRLRVCVVDMDEDQHVEAAILDNNSQAQGDWNFEMLASLMSRPKVRRAATGFSIQDVYTMFGQTGAAMKADADAMDLSKAMEKAQERQTLLKRASSQRDGPDFYAVLIFESAEDRQFAHDLFGWAQTPWQDGAAFTSSYKDFLAFRGLHPARHPIDQALGAAAFLVEQVAPMRAADPKIIDPETRSVIANYLRQALAELDK